jgi:hypothetical protein
MESITELQSWLQIATSTGFVGLAWYLIVIALPRMQERFDEHSKMQITEFRNQIKDLIDRHERQIQSMNLAHEKQIDLIKAIKTCQDRPLN